MQLLKLCTVNLLGSGNQGPEAIKSGLRDARTVHVRCVSGADITFGRPDVAEVPTSCHWHAVSFDHLVGEREDIGRDRKVRPAPGSVDGPHVSDE